MKPNEVVTIGGNLFTYVLSAIQQNEILQYIEFAISILISLLLIAYRVWKWWKEARKDGKIDSKEIREGLEIIKDGKKIVQQIAEKKKGEENNGENQ